MLYCWQRPRTIRKDIQSYWVVVMDIQKIGYTEGYPIISLYITNHDSNSSDNSINDNNNNNTDDNHNVTFRTLKQLLDGSCEMKRDRASEMRAAMKTDAGGRYI